MAEQEPAWLVEAGPSKGVAADGVVVGAFGYVLPQEGPLFNYMHEPPPGLPWHNGTYVMRSMPVEDLRARRPPDAPQIEREGFELRSFLPGRCDFADDEAVRRVYYPEVSRLALEVTGGSRAYVFDHLLRKREAGRPPLTFGRSGDGSQPAAVGRVHNDYTEESGIGRLEKVLVDPDMRQGIARFCIVNIWRPTSSPVLDTPLALCDARTVGKRDLAAATIHYPNRTGSIYLLHHSALHRWFYCSEMRPDEAFVFKQYDSQVNGVSRFTPHAAFDHPATPPDAPLRESIEARCLVVFS